MSKLPPSPRLPRLTGRTEEDLLRLVSVLSERFRDVAQSVNGVAEGRIAAHYNSLSAQPTGGVYAKGDFIKNNSPTIQGTGEARYAVLGWIVTEDGTASASSVSPAIALLDPDGAQSIHHPYAGLEWTISATTTISVAGEYVKAAGTTAITNSSQEFTASASNQLQYMGPTRHFTTTIHAVLDLGVGSNIDIGVQLYRHDDSSGTGSLIPHTEVLQTTGANQNTLMVTNGDFTLEDNDYIELRVANHTNTTDIIVHTGYMYLVGVQQ